MFYYLLHNLTSSCLFYPYPSIASAMFSSSNRFLIYTAHLSPTLPNCFRPLRFDPLFSTTLVPSTHASLPTISRHFFRVVKSILVQFLCRVRVILKPPRGYSFLILSNLISSLIRFDVLVFPPNTQIHTSLLAVS